MPAEDVLIIARHKPGRVPERPTQLRALNRSNLSSFNLLGLPATTAILDRFLEQAEIISITGKSYRMKNRACKEKK